jgi:hypothetical protein
MGNLGQRQSEEVRICRVGIVEADRTVDRAVAAGIDAERLFLRAADEKAIGVSGESRCVGRQRRDRGLLIAQGRIGTQPVSNRRVADGRRVLGSANRADAVVGGRQLGICLAVIGSPAVGDVDGVIAQKILIENVGRRLDSGGKSDRRGTDTTVGDEIDVHGVYLCGAASSSSNQARTKFDLGSFLATAGYRLARKCGPARRVPDKGGLVREDGNRLTQIERTGWRAEDSLCTDLRLKLGAVTFVAAALPNLRAALPRTGPFQ